MVFPLDPEFIARFRAEQARRIEQNMNPAAEDDDVLNMPVWHDGGWHKLRDLPEPERQNLLKSIGEAAEMMPKLPQPPEYTPPETTPRVPAPPKTAEVASDMAKSTPAAIAPRKIQLTSHHRCDACSAQARVKVTMPSGKNFEFCKHHYEKHELNLGPHIVDIDERYALAAPLDVSA